MLRDYRVFLVWMLFALVIHSKAAPDEPVPVSRWIQQLEHTIAGQRARAAAQLAQYGAEAHSAIAPLIVCLDDSNADVRLYASFALGRIAVQPAKTVVGLVPALTDDDEHVRYSAAWSIARIAQQVDASSIQSIEELETLTAAFRQAHTELMQPRHQPRHRLAVADAIAALTTQLAKLNPPVATEPAPVIAVDTDRERHQREIEQTVTEFRESSLLGRLRLIERLAASGVDLELRSKVLTEALILSDYRAVHFASHRWAEAARQVFQQTLNAQRDDSQLPEWTIGILTELIPQDPECSARLLRMAQSTQLSPEMRCAAIGAIGRKLSGTADELAILTRIIGRRDEDESVRMEAVECLATFGAASIKSVETLIKILRDAETATAIRGASAAAIGRIAPNHHPAVEATCATLSQLDTHDYFYVQLIESLGHFGPTAIDAVKYCNAGLAAQDEYVRLRCAETLAKLGPNATAAIPELVARIIDADESTAVKVAAAKAIKALGPNAIEAVGKHLNHPQAQIRDDVLRTLVVAGADARMTMPACIARLADVNEAPRVRAAAATALAEMREFAAVAAPTLLQVIKTEKQPDLRGAALIALAQVSPASRAEIAPFAAESNRRIRASAAFALHLCGETRRGLEVLIEMLDGSEQSEPIEAAITDIGAVAIPTLLQTVRNPQARDEQRLACFRVTVQLERTNWAPLLDLLGDERLGEEFYECLLGLWDSDVDLLPDLVASLDEPRLTPDARDRVQRLIDYLTSDLGAGGEEPGWEGGFALTRPSQAAEDRSIKIVAKAQGAAAGAGAPDAMAREAIEREAMAREAMARNAVERDSARAAQSPAPSFAPAATDDQQLAMDSVNSVASDTPRLVRVFYGTNRIPIDQIGGLLAIASPVAAAIGISLATIIFCVIMFLRLRAARFAFAAFVGLVAIGYFGARAITNPSSYALHASNTIEYTGGLRSETDLGFCEVSIPEIHEPGELEAPTLFRLEVEQDPAKHIVMQSVARLSHDEFYRLLHTDLDRKGKNLLVFVHGYNVSFEDAARRTAQMAYDLKFPGAPVFFSWPSQANWYRYGKDKENIELSVEQIKSFLQELAAKSNADTINLVAHSMGTVGLTAALQAIEQSGDRTLFNQVVLAAPDIDAKIFKQEIAPKIVTKARHVTLYTSQTDLALIASRYFNRGARVGDSGAEVLVFPGIDTIDASAVDTSLLGHAYYGSSVSVLHDLGLLLEGQPIESRQYLRSVPLGDQAYWLFDPSKIARQTASASAIAAPIR